MPVSKIGRGVWQRMQSLWSKLPVASRTSGSVKARPCVFIACSAKMSGWQLAQYELCITASRWASLPSAAAACVDAAPRCAVLLHDDQVAAATTANGTASNQTLAGKDRLMGLREGSGRTGAPSQAVGRDWARGASGFDSRGPNARARGGRRVARVLVDRTQCVAGGTRRHRPSTGRAAPATDSLRVLFGRAGAWWLGGSENRRVRRAAGPVGGEAQSMNQLPAVEGRVPFLDGDEQALARRADLAAGLEAAADLD